MKQWVREYWIHILLFLGCMIPGVIGYLCAGASGEQAVYASLTLLFANPIDEFGAQNTGLLVWIAKYCGVFFTASVAIRVVGQLLHMNLDRIFSAFGNMTAIYTDLPQGKRLVENEKKDKKERAILIPFDEHTKLCRARKQIILLSDDLRALDFYCNNKDKLKDKKVFIGLRQTSFALLEADPCVHYFNVVDLLARRYWKENALNESGDVFSQDSKTKECRIVITGGNTPMGKAIFKYAYLTNLYDVNQKITYELWDCTPEDIALYESLNLAPAGDPKSRDCLIVKRSKESGKSEDSGKPFLSGFDAKNLDKNDRVILAGDNVLAELQYLLKQSPCCKIHCCHEGDMRFEDVIQCGNGCKVLTFGNPDDVLTIKDVTEETTLTIAKLFHLDYTLNGNELSKDKMMHQANSEWSKLNGFLKGSNIARADHYHIWKKIRERDKEKDDDNKDSNRLEHVRWCRYHYYEGWEFGEQKDNDKRKHHLLTPFDCLAEEDKNKDDIRNETIKAMIDEALLQ